MTNLSSRLSGRRLSYGNSLRAAGVLIFGWLLFAAPDRAICSPPERAPKLRKNGSTPQNNRPKDNPERWKKAIAAFEQADRNAPPPQGAILFVGSSSIRLWKLHRSFPKRKTINRGFGGSHISDSIFYADTLILKHKPRIVVLYAGDNDIAAGKTPRRVARDFQRLVTIIHQKLPQTRILFLAIKPSLRRWSLVDRIKQANALIAKQCAADKRLQYVDIFTPMLGADGKPRPELFAKDGLHLNAAGYALWAKILRPGLDEQP